MIDWSNSDYTQLNTSLLFVSEVDEGVFLTSSYNVTEHHCYQCKQETDEAQKQIVQSIEPVQESAQESFVQPKELQTKELQPKELQTKESFVPVDKGVLERFLMYFSNDSMILIFIIFLLFMIYLELRISNMRHTKV